MSNVLSEKIKKAIQEDLSNQVATELQEYLAAAAVTKVTLEEVNTSFDNLHKEVLLLRAQKSLYESNKTDRVQLDKAQITLDLKTQLMEMREKHADVRISEIRGLTETVFRSNRLNYNVSLGMPNSNYNKQDPNTGCIDYNQQVHMDGNATKVEDNT